MIIWSHVNIFFCLQAQRPSVPLPASRSPPTTAAVPREEIVRPPSRVQFKPDQPREGESASQFERRLIRERRRRWRKTAPGAGPPKRLKPDGDAECIVLGSDSEATFGLDVRNNVGAVAEDEATSGTKSARVLRPRRAILKNETTTSNPQKKEVASKNARASKPGSSTAVKLDIEDAFVEIRPQKRWASDDSYDWENDSSDSLTFIVNGEEDYEVDVNKLNLENLREFDEYRRQLQATMEPYAAQHPDMNIHLYCRVDSQALLTRTPLSTYLFKQISRLTC
jgi:hypothetical protein